MIWAIPGREDDSFIDAPSKVPSLVAGQTQWDLELAKVWVFYLPLEWTEEHGPLGLFNPKRDPWNALKECLDSLNVSTPHSNLSVI